MFLNSVRILGLRSIENAALEACGHFNILIGKNNAGKSNLLASIRGFFHSIESGNVIMLEPMFSAEEDFYNRMVQHPISITCTFRMSKDDASSTFLSISNEFPQISSAISGLSAASFVQVTMKYYALPQAFSLLSRIAVGSNDDTDKQEEFTTLFEVSDDNSPQLFELFSRLRQKKDEIDLYNGIITSFDEDDFSRFKGDKGGRIPLRYVLDRYVPERTRRLAVSQYIVPSIEAEIESASTYSEFRQSLVQKVRKLASEIKQIEKTPIAGTIYTIGGQQHVVPEYVLSLCKRLASIKVLYQSERREPIGPADAQRLLSLRVKKGGEKLFRTFQTTVAALTGVEVDAFEDETPAIPVPSFDRVRGAKLDVDNFLVQANGSGIKEAIRLMINIELDKPDIMLIEEPELHLHPALETSVMRYLKKKAETSLIFITTHSTNFIDSGEYSAIFFVKKELSTTAILLTTEKAADILPTELGLRLSSLFMFEKLVFVEGTSDEDTLREWAATLQYNLTQASVGFILLGGSRNIHHFAARNTTDFLARRGVEMWFILDRDENMNGNISVLQERLGPQCKIRSLPVREIENYFIRPGVIHRFLVTKISKTPQMADGLGVIDLSIAEVEKAIDRCADSLRSFAFGKFLSRQFAVPMYINPEFSEAHSEDEVLEVVKSALVRASSELNSRALELDRVISEVRAQFDRAWEMRKLSVVPGDELLRAVMKEYKFTYRKSRDAKQLAAIMEPAEIPSEVVALLSEIAPRVQ